MPKRKPDTVVSHRIELQETERDLLRAYVVGNTAGNVLNGVGAMIAPLAPVFGAAATAWLALYTADEIKEFLDEEVIPSVRSEYADSLIVLYREFTAYLGGKNWSDFSTQEAAVVTWGQIQAIQEEFSTREETITLIGTTSKPINPTELNKRITLFMATFNPLRGVDRAIENGWSPAEAWSNFYPIEEAINDYIDQKGTISNTADFILQIFGKGWLWDTGDTTRAA